MQASAIRLVPSLALSWLTWLASAWKRLQQPIRLGAQRHGMELQEPLAHAVNRKAPRDAAGQTESFIFGRCTELRSLLLPS